VYEALVNKGYVSPQSKDIRKIAPSSERWKVSSTELDNINFIIKEDNFYNSFDR